MMTKNLLVELLVEELPPKSLKQLGNSFAELLATSSKTQGLIAQDAIGIIKEIPHDPNRIGDTIPVDTVVANILVASAFNSKSHKLSLYHVGSSDRNPLIWRDVQQIVQDYWNSNISPSRVSKSKAIYSSNTLLIKAS